MDTETLAWAVDDLEYVHHGDRTLSLRLFRPAGEGPFPTVVNLHGGAWNKGDFNECRPRDEALVAAGFASAALDFRQAGDGYPSSLADINFAVRWLKSRAAELDLDAEQFGLAGQSSGGHLAMLAAMRPSDPRYASIALEGADVTAEVRCVGMTWPVMNPYSRYHHALRARASESPPAWVGDIPERHDTYWQTEDAMREGNPLLALERAENVLTPPAVWIQGTPDPVHDYRDPDSPVALNEPERFATSYRDAGGSIEVVYIEQAQRAEASLAPLVAFFDTHLR